jgi:hypothetical protein
MRYLALTTILIVTTGVAMSQQRPKYETVPDHTVLLAIASQANCPLKIESATFLRRVDQPGELIKYRVRNVSNKPISFISVMIQNSSSSSENFMPLGRSGRLLPNEMLDSARFGIDYDLVSASKSVPKPATSDEALKTLYILLVEKVEFTDGTTYDDTRTLEAAFRFFLDGCNR